jgi:hypothetical protein
VKFNDAYAELRPLGITIKMVPGGYSIRRTKAMGLGTTFDNLAEALAYGRSLAAQNDALRDLPPLGPMGKKSKRGEMYRHNRKIAAKRAKSGK